MKFLEGVVSLCGAGDASMKNGLSIHLFACNASMKDEAFYNSDAEMLFVVQEGEMTFLTENGRIKICPKEIAVMPRGIKFAIEVTG